MGGKARKNLTVDGIFQPFVSDQAALPGAEIVVRNPLAENPLAELHDYADLDLVPANLESLPLNEVEKILNNRDYIKAQLAELGEKRFGISRSELLRRGRDGVLGSIHVALENERTLKIIAQEARRVGALRSA